MADRLRRDRLARRLQRDAARRARTRPTPRWPVAGHRRGRRPRGLRRRPAGSCAAGPPPGTPLRRGPVEIPSPSELDARPAHAVLDSPGRALGVLAVAALVDGRLPGARLAGHRPGDRATTTIILAAWNVLVGLWLGDEAMRLRRGEADGHRVDRPRLRPDGGARRRRPLARPRRDGAGRPDHPRRRGRRPRAAWPPGASRAGAACRWRPIGVASSPRSRSILPIALCRGVTAACAWSARSAGRSSRTAPSRPRAPARAAARPTPAAAPRPPEAVGAGARAWGVEGRRPAGARPAPVRGDPPPAPAPAAAITSDRRDGFYLWWVFARDGGRDRAECCGTWPRSLTRLAGAGGVR